MTPQSRLKLIALLIVGSAGYAMLITKDVELAKVVGLGYVCVLLTILVVLHLGKKSQ